MTIKILLFYIVCTISYCTVFPRDIKWSILRKEIKWSAIGSTVIMECYNFQNNTSKIYKGTSCFWEFRKCTQDICWRSSIDNDNDRIKVNGFDQSKGNFNLQISNMSMGYQADYFCYCPNYGIYTYRLKVKGQPRFLEKDENNTLLGIEGGNLTLMCELEEGLLPEQLLVTNNELTVAYGGPEYVNYTFILRRADHLSDFICIANSSELDSPLVDRVTIYIKHIPDPPIIVLSNTCTSKAVSWIAGASGNVPQVFLHRIQTSTMETLGTYRSDKPNQHH